MKHLETSSLSLYLWEFQRARKKNQFLESLINKGKHQNFKKKHLLIHLETSSENLYLWEFQRTGKKFPFAESFINKGKQANHKKKHLVNHLETFSKSLYLSVFAIAYSLNHFVIAVFQRLGEMFPFAESLINKGKHQNSKKTNTRGLEGPADT